MSKIRTTTELICRLKTKGITLSDFDYKEGITTNKYMEAHPFISIGRRYYQNPHFWTVIFESDLSDEADFMYNMREFSPDYTILTSFIVAHNKIADRYIPSLINRFFVDNKNVDIEIKKKAISDLMVDAAYENRLDIYKLLEKAAIEGGIEPLYGTYANSGNGYCLYNACRHSDREFAHYLLDHDADVTLNDSMAFAIACKDANYKLALELVNKGIDIHTKKDLGRLMIMRNDRLHKEISEENLAVKDELLKLFEKSDENELLSESIPGSEFSEQPREQIS